MSASNKLGLMGKMQGSALGEVQAKVEQEAATNLGGCVSIAYGTPCRDGDEVTVAYVAVESHVLEDFGAGFHKCVKCGENGTPTRPLSSRLAYLVQEPEALVAVAYTLNVFDCPNCYEVNTSDADFGSTETCDQCGKEVQLS